MKHALFFAFFLLACQQKKAANSNPAPTPAAEDDDDPEPPDTKPNARTICKAPQGVTNDPRSIQDVVTLINALPKPVSVACFLDVLKGPFRVNATSNTFSGQPAYSKEAPRIFLFYEPLLISIVPRGIGGDVVEFSIRTDVEKSIKGEIPFPVTANIADDLPYTHITFKTSSGTVCGPCHPSEVPATGDYPSSAYVSQFLPTTDYYDVSTSEIEASAARCKTEVLPECPVLQALTSQGALIPASF